MSSLFRRKLCCFYCSHQLSVQTLRHVHFHPNGRPCRFTCPDCSADNHLDENGEILDYVPEPPSHPAPVFARRRRQSPRGIIPLTERTTLPPPLALESPPPSPTFCRTCLHNQQIVTKAIATYDLPPEDHPDYAEHVNYLFPQRRRELEERWPAVCPDCAPKVNDRLRLSNYRVKVASLGQMLARSSGYEDAAVGGERDGGGGGGRGGGGSGGGRGKRRFAAVVWWVRGGAWCYTHFLVLVWHGSAVLRPDAREMVGVASWVGCVLRSRVAKEVDGYCYGVAARQAARWIPWSLVALFWIYRERDLQRHPHKKLVGAREYLQLEWAIYALRLASWYFLAPGSRFTFTEETFTRLHLGLLFLSVMSTLFSITCLKLEDPPSFSLREPSPIPSTPSPPSSPPRRIPRHPMSPVTPLRPPITIPPPSTVSTTYSPFKFRPRSISPSPAPRRTAAPSPDVMDWNLTTAQETTFRAPPPQPSFFPQPHRPPARDNPFAHRALQGPEFTKLSATGYRLSSPQYAPMAPQRFFIDDEATGLETLMGGGLRLDDAPVAVRAEEAWWRVAARVSVVAAAGGMVYSGEMWIAGVMGVGAMVFRRVWEAAVAAVVVGVAVYVREQRVISVVVGVAAAREVWNVLMRLQRARARAFYERERRREDDKEERRNERDGSVVSVGSVGSVGSASDRGRAGRAGSAGLERRAKGRGRGEKRKEGNMAFSGLTL